MSFIFPILLGGLVLAGVPVLLHLIMRQKPKRLPFPAFRFLLKRHRTNLRRLRLRHLVLLALRVLLIAAVCLALARPKVFSERLNLAQEAPVAAVLVIDTSPSMTYVVENKNGPRSRLEDAKRRAREFIDELPPDSKVAILDTARSGKVWHAPAKARAVIEELKPRWANASVTERLHDAYGMLEKLALAQDDADRRMQRFVFVFSDRTPGCWDATLVKGRQDDADRIPPPFDRLARVADEIPPLLETLRSLPGAGKGKGGLRELIDQLQKLRDYIPGATVAEYPDAQAVRVFSRVRRLLRDTADQMQTTGGSVADKGERAKVRDQLATVLHDLKGALEVFVDVGVAKPMDLAIVDLRLPRQIDSETPRQAFAPDEVWPLNVTVAATGADYDNPPLDCLLDGKKVAQKPLGKLRAGTTKAVTFDIDARRLHLSKGLHQVEVKVPSLDALGFNDSRFATFQIRDARPVLTITDSPGEKTDYWARAVSASREFRCTVLSTKAFLDLSLDDVRKYRAICLFGIVQPSPELWQRVEYFVESGGGVAVLPPTDPKRAEDSKASYNDEPVAQRILPGKLVRVVKTEPQPGLVWDWQPNTYRGLLKPFQRWNAYPDVDFVRVKRRAETYWEVTPYKKTGDVLIRYEEKSAPPALLETLFKKVGRGKVVLFTTPLEYGSSWNNYMQSDSSFCVILPHLTMKYLAGSGAGVNVNFRSGEPVALPLPPGRRHPPYTVEPAALEDAGPLLDPPPGENLLRIKGAVRPGNYSVLDNNLSPVTAFSVNLLPVESDLTRLPEEQITSLFGPGSVLPVSKNMKLLDALREHWKQPVELLPLLLVLLLLVLVVENLLANKFYRREPDAGSEKVSVESAPS
jgi:hypothetical protein